MVLRLTKNAGNTNINHLLCLDMAGTTRGELRIGDYTTSGSMITINTLGNIGVGITNPEVPLHVGIGIKQGTENTDWNIAPGAYFVYGASSWITSNEIYPNYSGGVSIKSSNWVITNAGYAVLSDNRIKKNMQDIDDSSALEKIRLIQPKTYNYIDDRVHTTDKVYGFSAQQVHSVLPYSIILQKDYIPNVFSMATVGNNGNVLSIPDTSVLQNQNTNGSVFIPIRCYVDEQDTEIITNVINIIDDKSVEIDTAITSGSNIFIYGQQVNDLHTLNKDAIWTVATAALQELDRQLQAEREKVSKLEQFIQSKYPGEYI